MSKEIRTLISNLFTQLRANNGRRSRQAEIVEALHPLVAQTEAATKAAWHDWCKAEGWDCPIERPAQEEVQNVISQEWQADMDNRIRVAVERKAQEKADKAEREAMRHAPVDEEKLARIFAAYRNADVMAEITGHMDSFLPLEIPKFEYENPDEPAVFRDRTLDRLTFRELSHCEIKGNTLISKDISGVIHFFKHVEI